MLLFRISAFLSFMINYGELAGNPGSKACFSIPQSDNFADFSVSQANGTLFGGFIPYY